MLRDRLDPSTSGGVHSVVGRHQDAARRDHGVSADAKTAVSVQNGSWTHIDVLFQNDVPAVAGDEGTLCHPDSAPDLQGPGSTPGVDRHREPDSEIQASAPVDSDAGAAAQKQATNPRQAVD